MKKKTLAAASLLLALLMPLGITPLAVYADEGDGTTQSETPNVNEDSEGTGETNTAKTVNATPTSLNAGQIRVTNIDENIDKIYPNLGDAVKNAPSGSTIELSAGTYSLYSYSANPKALHDSSQSPTDSDWQKYITGKSLTFVGHSADDTFWNIGTPYYDAGGEANGDYSFDGANVITFKNLTLQSPVQYDGTLLSSQKNYTGFIRPNETIVEDCVINGRTAYWGYKSAMFKNTTFNAPSGDYAIWTYSSPEMTFDNCTFNASGKVINVYTDFGATQHDFTINFDSCTVNSTKANKTALSINDSLMTDSGCNHKFYVNIIGNNTIKGLKPDTKTCSRLFGFSNDKIYLYNGKELHYDSGATVVTINGKPVWKDAARFVEHNGNNFDEGTYDNGNGNGNANQYTEGYKDNAFDTNVTEWTLKANTTNTYVRTITKQCQYCHEKIVEQEEKAGYCLRYDLNGGTGAEGTYNNTYYPPQDGNTATVAADPSRAGYQFAGWQDADGNRYAAGDTVTVDRDITLTAQWNKLVTVSFDLCGHGGANIPSQTFVSGNKASEPTAPKEDGWVFGGWYTEKGCQYRFSFDSAVTSDITLYAKWDRVTTVVSTPTPSSASVATPTPSPAPAATPTPSPAAAATKTATVKNAAIPQTSDAFPMEGLLALLAVGAVGFGAAGWLRKKHH